MTLPAPPPKFPLQPMAAFVDACPPPEPFGEREVSTVYLHPWQRFSIHTEQSPEHGAAMWRSDELAAAGIFAAAEDSKEFAAAMLAALADHLSLRNLADLRDAIVAEIDKQEVSRAIAMGKSGRAEG